MLHRYFGRALRVIALSSTVLLASPAVQAQGWDFMDLGSFMAGSSHATGINNQGQVVGYGNTSATVGSPYSGFLYSNGSFTTTGPFAGASASLNDINNNGVAVGNSSNLSAFTYVNGEMTGISGVSRLSAPVSINDSGQMAIVSSQALNAGINSSYLYSNGVATNIGSLGGGNTNAAAINNLGQITGGTYNAANQQQAFLYSNGAMTSIGRMDGARVTIPTDINNAGTIVGYSFDNDPNSSRQYASVYSNGQWTNLLPNASVAYANAVNNLGAVVGVADGHGFMYSNGSYLDLMSIPQVQTAGWSDMTATDINDRGQIVGWGNLRRNDTFETHAFLLSPAALGGGSGSGGGVGSVPEPESTGLMMLGLGLLAWVTRRRRGALPA